MAPTPRLRPSTCFVPSALRASINSTVHSHKVRIRRRRAARQATASRHSCWALRPAAHSCSTLSSRHRSGSMAPTCNPKQPARSLAEKASCASPCATATRATRAIRTATPSRQGPGAGLAIPEEHCVPRRLRNLLFSRQRRYRRRRQRSRQRISLANAGVSGNATSRAQYSASRS